VRFGLAIDRLERVVHAFAAQAPLVVLTPSKRQAAPKADPSIVRRVLNRSRRSSSNIEE